MFELQQPRVLVDQILHTLNSPYTLGPYEEGVIVSSVKFDVILIDFAILVKNG